MNHDQLKQAMLGHHRQLKAVGVLVVLLLLVWCLHAFGAGVWVAWVFTLLIGIHLLTMALAKPKYAQFNEVLAELPHFSLVVSAQNEERVIERAIASLMALDYPKDQFEVWAINDNSTDGTGEVLAQCQLRYPTLNIHTRGNDAQGAKSGALNSIHDQLAGEIIGVVDADATLLPNTLTMVAKVFASESIGGVQLRKQVSNPAHNVLTQCQADEMRFDAYMQQQRIALSQLGELRGNGQFVRREVITELGGWNEQTITDDLDLTFRLHLAGHNVHLMSEPHVLEEAVTDWPALWKQRLRWAEGGYQRFLDYARLIFKGQMGPLKKTYDALVMGFVQFLLPIAVVADVILALWFHQWPRLLLLLIVASLASWLGIRKAIAASDAQLNAKQLNQRANQTNRYLVHWVAVTFWMQLKMLLFAKRIAWSKTAHHALEGE